MNIFKNLFSNIDWVIFCTALFLSFAGLSILYSPVLDNAIFFKQLISLSVAIFVFFVVSNSDVYFLKKTNFIYFIYFFAIAILLLLPFFGSNFSGATSWFSFGFFTFQPTDFVKIVLIILLSKYFFKRYVEIHKIRHLFISGIYSLIFFVLILAQPDLGSAMIIFFIWFGFVLISKIPKKYILALALAGSFVFVILYNFFLSQYQIERIQTFLNPNSDVLGSGYNIIQAKTALGSGGFFGKGFLEGTQSRLNFLPEYDTDFIFSSFGEEWGWLGIFIICFLFLILFYRLISTASKGRSNFESFFICGIAIYFFAHFFVHVAINLGVLPVTGITMPFMSNGGSHLVMEFLALGLVNAFAKKNKQSLRQDIKNNEIFF